MQSFAAIILGCVWGGMLGLLLLWYFVQIYNATEEDYLDTNLLLLNNGQKSRLSFCQSNRKWHISLKDLNHYPETWFNHVISILQKGPILPLIHIFHCLLAHIHSTSSNPLFTDTPNLWKCAPSQGEVRAWLFIHRCKKNNSCDATLKKSALCKGIIKSYLGDFNKASKNFLYFIILRK